MPPLQTRQVSSHCFGDPLELPEEVELGIFAGIAPFGVEQTLGDVEEQRGATQIAGVNQIEINTFTDDALVLGNRRADEIRGQLQHGIVVELRGQPFLRQFDAIACHTGKADFEVIAVGTNGLDVDGLAGRLRGRDHRLGGEIEGNAQHIGIFHIEQVFLIEIVGLAAQCPADDLLAQKLGAEGAHAQHMGDGVGIPALGEHGDRHDAANRFAEAAFLADRVHDFPEQDPDR